MESESPESELLSIRVQLKNAEAVFVAGEFNNWSTARTPMTPLADGIWEITLPLLARIQGICFVVWEAHTRYARFLREDELKPEIAHTHK